MTSVQKCKNILDRKLIYSFQIGNNQSKSKIPKNKNEIPST